MEDASRFVRRGFDDDDDDEDLGHQPDGASYSRKLGDYGGKNISDQRPNTPRSKHSATEQRRRSKINDRFQILREIIPNSDQKRDKASFLLEVIEYIRCLQEKVQKYELIFPELNQDNSKLMPWEKVFYRSIWKNAQQSNGQGAGDGIGDPHAIRNDATTLGLMFSGRHEENNSLPVAPLHVTRQNTAESDHIISDNMQSQSQPPYERSSCLEDCTVSNEIMNDQEIAIDKGEISMSAIYSQGLLDTLTQALRTSGVDLSHANISVQINLGRRAKSKLSTVSTEKAQPDLSSGNQATKQLKLLRENEESVQEPKRLRSGSS